MTSTKYVPLKQKTALKRKPSLPYLAAIEKTIPHIENQWPLWRFQTGP